jgi:phosphoribosylaminoimidazole-succinocarboxamide synthase
LGLKSKSAGSSSTNELSKRDLLFDKEDYFTLEYSDYFSNEQDKRIRVKSLGEKFASINSFFLEYLKEYHIPAAFVKTNGKNILKFLNHTRFPFSVKVINTTDKRTAKIFGKKEQEILNLPIFEFHYGTGKDTIVSESHLISFGLCCYEDLKLIIRICSKVNAVLKSFFERRNEILAEVICNFGKAEGKIFLIDDFTPRSIKVLPQNHDKNDKWINPYKLTSPSEVKKYTDHIFNLMSS